MDNCLPVPSAALEGSWEGDVVQQLPLVCVIKDVRLRVLLKVANKGSCPVVMLRPNGKPKRT